MSYLLAALSISSMNSCSGGEEEDDDSVCYRCTLEYDGDEYTETLCFSYFKFHYDWTLDEFEDYIEEFEDFADADCRLKK